MTGKDKKMNYPVIKHIRITDQQNANWDYKKVRGFLSGNSNNTEIVAKFRRLYDIMNLHMKFKGKVDLDIINELEQIEVLLNV